MRIVSKFLDAFALIVARDPSAPTKGRDVAPAPDEEVTDRDVAKLNWAKRLRDTLAFYNDPANDKINAVTAEAEAVTSIMLGNVQRVIQRGDQLDHMHDLSGSVAASAREFESSAVTLRRNMCARNVQVTILCIGVCVILVILGVLVLCKPNFSRCNPSG